MVYADTEMRLWKIGTVTGLGGQSRGGQAVSINGRYYNVLQEGLLDLHDQLKQQEAS